ncbi:hypothetical protein [Jiella avicenniae]|uniref:Uncharacterized protein n=1 Tax=Jiella avicenniae TaxID=2907202 RepID=A0A9X1NXX8_9HYPH|nr:hypothetical protein [Jiella avicenniae]MCE7026416.1 hypothetical protein [Jiella avicenniae]
MRPAASRHNAGGKFGAKHVDADMRAEMTIFDSLPGSCRAILADAPFNYVPSAIAAQLAKGRSVEGVCATMRASIRAHLDAAYKSRGIAR